MAAFKPQLRLVSDASIASGTGDEAPSHSEIAHHVLYVERLYHEYRDSLLAYVARLLPGGAQDADVIIQETYVRLLRQNNLDHLKQNPRAYIFTVATNLVRDALRRHLRRHGDAHESLNEQEHLSPDASPPHTAQWQQSLDRLVIALMDLKPITRHVFLLSRFEEMTYPEIAEALAVSTRTVERHMVLAFTHLQKTLEDML